MGAELFHVNRLTDTEYDDANSRVSQFANTPKTEELQ